MLRSLQIENYALIRSLNIDFDNGFTVITGETGAGKSIILGALSLILGNRADTAVLFDTSKKCFVEAHFDLTYFDLSAFFNEYDLDYENDTVVRREVNEKGKSRAFINDTPVTLLVLKEFASCLIDIHSQHHNLLFNNASYRLYVVDQFANNQTLVNQYNTKFQQWKKVEKECQELKEKQQRSLQEKDFLNYILQELENAAMYIGEQEEIEEKIAILSNAELIKSKLYQSVQLLSEEEQNVLQQLKELKGHIGAIISCNVAFQQYDQRIENTILELKDLAYDISKKELEIEVNPQMLQTLSERMDLLFSLQQKHHANSIEELLQQLENIREQLSLMTDESQRLELLENKRKTLYLEASQLAQTISGQRHKVVTDLEKEMLATIYHLGMQDAGFKIKIETGDKLLENGLDQVAFLFSANKGSALMEIEKVASGGELSRLMLAIKSIITDSTMLPTVVFDEIDTGISGEIAGKVALLMQKISQQHQLLVITHLPQIAAKGKLHYFVFKEVVNGKTYTNIKPVSGAERELEIAKMMSGDHLSQAAIAAAKELINS